MGCPVSKKKGRRPNMDCKWIAVLSEVQHSRMGVYGGSFVFFVLFFFFAFAFRISPPPPKYFNKHLIECFYREHEKVRVLWSMFHNNRFHLVLCVRFKCEFLFAFLVNLVASVLYGL